MIQNCKICSSKNIKTIEDTVNKGLCGNCSFLVTDTHSYYESNIPCNYWELNMPCGELAAALYAHHLKKEGKALNFKSLIENADNFTKDLTLIDKIYLASIVNVKKSYINGLSFCLAGTHGVGKTLTVSNILKKVLKQSFTALYTTLGDVVGALTLAPSEDKFAARKELTEVDFLVIDEFDSRFIGTENAADLFGRTLEHILRTRLQNKLPIIMVSNSPNPVETFNGALKQSLESLMNKVPLLPVIGKDFRKNEKL